MAGSLLMPFEETLRAMLRARSDDRRRELMSRLATQPDAAREAAVELLRDSSTIRRIRGAELIGQLCSTEPDRIAQLARILVDAFDRETDAAALTSIAFSLHWAVEYDGDRRGRGVTARFSPASAQAAGGDPGGAERGSPDHGLPDHGLPAGPRRYVWELMSPRRIERLVELADQPDAWQRREVAIALGEFVGLHRSVLDALIRLARDVDSDVRGWATFELAVGLAMPQLPEANDPAVLQVIRERLQDSECEIRNQAAYGLALRRDPRAVDIVDRQLRADEATDFVFDAAAELADPRLVPALEAISRWWPGEDREWLDEVLVACRGETEPVLAAEG